MTTHKTCTACGAEKPLHEFYVRKRDNDTGRVYYHAKCKPCLIAYQVKHKRENAPRDPAHAVKRRRRRNKGTGSFRVPASELLTSFADDLESRLAPPSCRAYDDAELRMFKRVAGFMRSCVRRLNDTDDAEIQTTQTCTRCGVERSLGEFGIKSRRADGAVKERFKHCSHCKAASLEKQREEERKEATDRMKAAMVRDMNRGEE